MAALFFLTLMVCYTILFQRIRSYQKQISVPGPGTTILLTLIGTKIYDTLVLSIGGVLGEGPLLQAISIPRFLFAGIFVPLLAVTALDFAGRLGLNLAERRHARALFWILAFGLITYEFAAGTMTASLQPEAIFGIVRYIPDESAFPLAAWMVAWLFMLTGLILLGKVRWPWLALFSALYLTVLWVPDIPFAPLVVAGAELSFLWTLVATENRVLRRGYEMSDAELDARLIGRAGPDED